MRVLRDSTRDCGGFAVSSQGWNKVDLFFDAWKAVGFRIVGHLAFRKRYASLEIFLRYEQAYLRARVMSPVSKIRSRT